MELKNYQKGVMRNLSSYMDCVNTTVNLFAAWEEYWRRQDIGVGFGGVPTYNNAIKGVPHICMKVPSPTFSYISAERIGPQRYYKQSYHEIYERNQVGFRGELFADYLVKRGLEDKVINKCVLFDEDTSEHLLYQTEKWLSVISPGIHINPKEYQEAGIVGIEYKVYGSDYTPVNVGFGLSYVVPIIVSLLKAKQGDLVIIENPEAHLHPKGQRKMGELIARVSAGGVQVILETHSDHILNGIRLSVKNGVISRSNIRLNYFYQKVESDLALGEKVIHQKCSPVILDDGSLSDCYRIKSY